MTQRDLALAAGFKHKQSVVRIEAGDSGVSVDRLVALAAALQVTTDELLARDDTQESPREFVEEFEGWAPNPALRGSLAPRAYEAALAYVRRLERAGLDVPSLERLERTLIDNRFARWHSSSRRVELSEEEQLEMVDITWQDIVDALAAEGVRP